MYETIRRDVPNIPEEAIRVWLLPFAEMLGWPPTIETWGLRLGNETISFWNDSEWTKENLNLSTLNYSRGYFDTMRGLHEAYNLNIENIYSRALGEDGKRRFRRCYQYIIKNRVFPKIPVVYINEIGEYEIMDGNHRFFGLVMVNRTVEEFENLAPNEKELLLEQLKQDNLLAPHESQEVMICRPKWENSEQAKTRQYLRSIGMNFI